MVANIISMFFRFMLAVGYALAVVALYLVILPGAHHVGNNLFYQSLLVVAIAVVGVVLSLPGKAVGQLVFSGFAWKSGMEKIGLIGVRAAWSGASMVPAYMLLVFYFGERDVAFIEYIMLALLFVGLVIVFISGKFIDSPELPEDADSMPAGMSRFFMFICGSAVVVAIVMVMSNQLDSMYFGKNLYNFCFVLLYLHVVALIVHSLFFRKDAGKPKIEWILWWSGICLLSLLGFAGIYDFIKDIAAYLFVGGINFLLMGMLLMCVKLKKLIASNLRN